MKKFIITEDERKHIMGLYEQVEPVEPSGQTEHSDVEVVVTDVNLNEVIQTPDKLVFIDFWASFCAPCLKLGKIFNELSQDEEYKDIILIGKYEFDFKMPIARKLMIRQIPFVMVYKNGQLVHKFKGEKDKDYLIKIIQKFK
jgi:thioredoxin 1